MLRPRDTATRECKPLTGLWRFRLDAAGEGRSARWFSGPLPDAGEMAVPASYNDIPADAAVHDHIGDAWYQTDGAGAARLGRAAGRAALRVGDAPGDGLGERRRGRRARGRLHAVRGRRHRARAGRRAGAGHRGGGQHADLPDGPARVSWRTPRSESDSVTGTTSSTTPASTVRCGCTRPRRPTSTDITVVTGLDGADGTVEYRVEAADADGRGGPGRAPRRRRRRGGHRQRRERHAASAGRAPVGAGRRLPLRPGGAAGRRHGHAARQLPPERGRADRRGAGHAVPRQRRAGPLHRLRHARGPRDAGQGAQRRPDAARLRAARVDRRELLPDLALPLLGGRAGSGRPPRRPGHRRDRRGRA